ncbi:MAG TPA: hypothetical protein VFF06_14030 [Polyangia bacterium]|nr:hypothetical protein [Polyangia bacterium]
MTGYLVAVAHDGSFMVTPLYPKWGRQRFTVYSSEEGDPDQLHKCELILDGDALIRRAREQGYGIALDPVVDLDTATLHFTEVTRDPDVDPPVDKEAVGVALLAPDGDVAGIMVIGLTSDDDLRAAERHARARGFTLVIQTPIGVCKSEVELRRAISEEVPA